MAGRDRDIEAGVEAQLDVLKPHQPGEEENYGTTNHPSGVVSDASRAPTQPAASTSQARGGEGVTHDSEKSIHQSERDSREDTKQALTRAEPDDGANSQAQYVEDISPSVLATYDPSQDFQEPHMIGAFDQDFDSSANTMWSLYGKKAESRDKVWIQYLKDDINSALVFAGLFSAALTPFLVDSKQNLKVNPTDQMVYYLQQHSTILSQISQQIASIAPEVSIPSAPPPAFPPFNPSASDVRINAFWFMALAFSLSAAFLATLSQQWVRDYVLAFQRYGDPQKSARVRQYLYEGFEKWQMRAASDAFGLLHVSLFLFFVGLADSTLNINTVIGLSTVVPIGICSFMYIFVTFSPVIDPQSPYHTSLSGLIWYAIRSSRPRIFRDWNWNGVSRRVSKDMAQGRLQLSMEETNERNERDERAFLWLLYNATEDAEIESIVVSIPAFLKKRLVSKEDVLPVVAQHLFINSTVHRPALHPAGPNFDITTTQEICRRIGLYFNTCKSRAVFANDVVWRMRAGACVKAMTSLIFYADAEAGWFGDSLQVLGDRNNIKRIHSLSLSGTDEDSEFVAHWRCLAIMAIRPTLKRDLLIKNRMKKTFGPPVFATPLKLGIARENDETFEHREGGLGSKISFAADMVRSFNSVISRSHHRVATTIDEVSWGISLGISRQLPGVDVDFPSSESGPFLRQTLELFHNPAVLGSISCRQPLDKFLDFFSRVDAYQDNSSNPEYEQVIKSVVWPKHLFQRRLWSLDDLLDGGLGFAVEIFLLSLRQILSTYPSQEHNSTLYITTFRAITSDRRRYGEWTFHATYNIVLGAVVSEQGLLRTFDYPDFITDEVWELLGDILEGHSGPQIDIAVRQLTDLQREDGGRHGAKALALISRLCTPRS